MASTRRARARTIMVQGTMSDVGKSLIACGLCRILADEGLRVAPFKSQNMALNSAVTADGAEIGRAQALQAEAARVQATSDMNPILLKPTSDHASEVIVCGRARTTMPARDYFAYRRQLVPQIKESFYRLSAAHDVVVIEGAGSPVELNLAKDDICNMGIARLLAAPVILVGDIERGGVFAQLAGTMMLLSDEERAYVRATVVNKFRGDATLFEDGRKILEERCGVPCAGVVGYLDVDLADEDSLSGRLAVRQRIEGRPIDVACIRLPRISNFTDLDPLAAHPAIGVRYVARPEELADPDLIVVPGTKSTVADLAWLRETGLADEIRRLAEHGTHIIGICGGYQMLGETIEDEGGAEAAPGTYEGLGLLPVVTRFCAEKVTRRSTAEVVAPAGPLAPLAGMRLAGFEIHRGETTRLGGTSPMRRLEGGFACGELGCARDNVCGCYLHGLFDAEGAADALARAYLDARGLTLAEGVTTRFGERYRDQQIDRLAAGLRAALDLDLIHRIIEEGV